MAFTIDPARSQIPGDVAANRIPSEIARPFLPGTAPKQGPITGSVSGGTYATNAGPLPGGMDPNLYRRAIEQALEWRLKKQDADKKEVLTAARPVAPPRMYQSDAGGVGPATARPPERMVPLFRELMPGGGYGPLTTRQMGANSVPAGSVPESQAATYGGPQQAVQQGNFLDPKTVYDDERSKAFFDASAAQAAANATGARAGSAGNF